MFQPSIEQLETTNLVYLIRVNIKNDNELAEKLGICKVTMYTRLKKSNWKKPEIALIKQLKTT